MRKPTLAALALTLAACGGAGNAPAGAQTEAGEAEAGASFVKTQVADFDGHAWHLYVLQVDARDRFIEELAARGIGTSVHFIPLHHLSHYRERYRYKPSDFPEATAAFERIVSLPIYPRMTDADVARVIEAVRDVAREVRS